MRSPLLLSFLFLAFASKPLLVRPDPLLDINGDKVLDTNAYYVVSAFWGAGGGGLNVVAGRNGTCPLDVFQEQFDLNRGRPLIFSPAVKKDDGTVHTSSDLNIKFTPLASHCMQSTVWRVDDYDEARGTWFITTNGVEGNPGAETLLNWFKFEKIQEGSILGYKIVHCPSVCESCVTLCSDVDVDFGSGRRLALTTDVRSFGFLFIKAEDVLREKLIAMH